MSELKFTENGVQLDGTWTPQMLRVLADVVEIVQRVPENQRQEVLDKAMSEIMRERNFPKMKLVWDKP